MIINKRIFSIVLSTVFILPNCFAGAKPVIITPDHIIPDKNKSFFYCITFIPETQGILIDQDSKKRKLKLPESRGRNGFTNPTCFTLDFLSGGSAPSPIYFTDIGGNNMCAYVDANSNFDYTDDGEPFHADANGKIKTRLVSPRNNKVSITCTYKLLPKLPYADAEEWLLKDYEKYNKGKKHLDSEFWLTCSPDNIKGQNIIIGQDSMCVTLFDGDCDGCYHSAQDKIALLPYGVDSASAILGYGGHQIEYGLIVGFKGQAYEVITENMDCGSIKLKPKPDVPAPTEVLIGQRLPQINVTLLNGKTADIRSLLIPGKATFINFWSTDTTYIQNYNMMVRDSLMEKSDSITIISFNLDEDISETKKYISENRMDWTQCISDKNVEHILYRDGQTPYGILLDADGNIVSFNVDPIETKYYLPYLYKKKK